MGTKRGCSCLLVILLFMVTSCFTLTATGIGIAYVVSVTPHNLPAEITAMARMFILAQYAYEREGKAGPFKADYSESAAIDCKYDSSKDCFWSITSNSRFLVDQVEDIVPYLVYEHAAYDKGNAPDAVIWFPFDGDESFHVLGQYQPRSNTILMNHRALYDIRYSDDRDELATIVHELIHAQGGLFLDGEPESYEGSTSSATLEVLAGMCHYGNRLACRSFWVEMGSMTRGALRADLMYYKMDWLYQALAKILWKSPDEYRWFLKSNAHSLETLEGQEGLQDVLTRYSSWPWEKIVEPALCLGTGIVTGHSEWQIMPMNDAQQMVSGITPYVCIGYHQQ